MKEHVFSKATLNKLKNTSLSLKLEKRERKLTTTFKSSEGIVSSRESIGLQLEGGGKIAYGEAAPLPGYSRERLEDVVADLSGLVSSRLRIEDSEKLQFPSSKFALSTAAYNLLAQIEDRSLASFFSKDPLTCIPMNYLNALPPEALASREEVCLKIKISPSNVDEVFKKVSSLPNHCIVRLDANQQFSKLEAISTFKKFQEFKIDYVEEPFRTKSKEELSLFKSETGLSIALDETLYEDPENIHHWVDCLAVSTLVLKPTFLGSLDFCYSIIESARAAKKKIVISSAFEHTIGFRACLELAASAGSSLSYCGLDTLRYYDSETIENKFRIEDGFIFY